MTANPILFVTFVIFAGAALLSTLALFTRQSMLVAYMVLGILLGPSFLGWVHDGAMMGKVGDIGILFLLFLLGMELDPKSLLCRLRKAIFITVVSSILCAAVGFGVGFYSGLNLQESIIIGAAMMFSSTIIGLKLIPQQMLHHRRIGEIVTGVLLVQDLIAILVLSLIQGLSGDHINWRMGVEIILALPSLVLIALCAQRWLLKRLIARFERMREYLFLLAIAWCLTLSEIASLIGMPHEIGAFIAGVALASSPVSHYLVEYMQPLRDFFLVLFFVAVGAGFYLEPGSQQAVLVPALIMAVMMTICKPLFFRYLVTYMGDTKSLGWEVGFRLGQISEFAILIAYMASAQSDLFGEQASRIVQASALISFFLSSYIVVWRYPTPMSRRQFIDD